jgi:1,2-diacylglycerol 3-alpha-glucosyltransferase
MRIGFVTSSYRPRINGVTLSVEAFAGILRDMGHEVYIMAPAYPGYEEKDVRTIRFKSHPLLPSPEDRLANMWYPSSRAKIRRILCMGFDILHTHGPLFLEFHGVRWARRIGCPVVHTYHTHWELYAAHYFNAVASRLLVQYLRPLMSRFLNRHDLVLTPSSQMMEVLRSYNVKGRIEVLPTGIDIAAFRVPGGTRYAGLHQSGPRRDGPHHAASRADGGFSAGLRFRRQWGIREETKVLLFVGRIVKEKNIPFLYQVLQKVLGSHPDTMLLLVGDGPDRRSLQDQAQNRGIGGNVRFCGYLPHRELIPAYHAADLFVFASLTETQGIVLTEAMACGTPVVAVSALGVIDIMESGKGGFLVEEDAEEFTAAVLRLLEDRRLYEKKSREASESAELWSIETMVLKLLRFYRELLENRADASVCMKG